jgi:adenine/guanine phosphoribosyltransferase-like PRPP-binding protein
VPSCNSSDIICLARSTGSIWIQRSGHNLRGELSLNSTSALIARLKAVSLLRITRERFKYAELSKITGVDEPTLNRYVHGILVPNLQHANKIMETVKPHVDISAKVRDLLNEKVTSYLDASSIFMRDITIPNWISYSAYEKYSELDVDTVLSVEDGGILMSVLIASVLEAKFLFAARGRDLYVGKVLEEQYRPYRTATPELVNPRLKRILSLPDGYIQKGDRVLLVDDIVWSGETMRALGRFVHTGKGEIAAASSLGVLSQDVAKELEKDLGCKLDYVTELGSSSTT